MPAPRFRFEFMLLPGETEADLRREDVLAGLLAPWVDPSAATVERSAVYTFHGLVAARWRDGRVFLAGDAAHQTPPFLGQGMCTGLRDAANLAWKLAAVLDGSADDTLLDTYQAEREPHARSVIDAAVDFGKLICLLDADEARARDDAFVAAYHGDSPAPDFLPLLAPGRAIGPDGGGVSPQPRLDGQRLDDLVGHTFLLCTDRPLEDSSPEVAWWADHGVVIDAASHPELEAVLDGSAACVVRPDRYVMVRGDVPTVTAFARGALVGTGGP
jgi:3-(3-hydroxy-phenyl)propionate hydroxylase